MKYPLFLMFSAAMYLQGCAHQPDSEIEAVAARPMNGRLLVVMDKSQYQKRHAITENVFLGKYGRYHYSPGKDVRDIAQEVLATAYENYSFSHTNEPSSGNASIALEIVILDFSFPLGSAKIVMSATGYGPDKKQLFSNTYEEEGKSVSGRMFLTAPFGLSSAVQESATDALRKIFVRLRADLRTAGKPRNDEPQM